MTHRTKRQVEQAYFYTPVGQLITQGLEHGHTLAEIAAVLGPSERSIQRWANEFGVTLPRNPGRKRKRRLE